MQLEALEFILGDGALFHEAVISDLVDQLPLSLPSNSTLAPLGALAPRVGDCG